MRYARRGTIQPLNGSRYAIQEHRRLVAEAPELLPQTLATLAIVSLQTELVYGIAKECGFRGRLRPFR